MSEQVSPGLRTRLVKLLRPVLEMAQTMWPKSATTAELAAVMSELSDGLRHCESCGGQEFVGTQRYSGYVLVVATMSVRGGLVDHRYDTKDGTPDYAGTAGLYTAEGPWKCKTCGKAL